MTKQGIIYAIELDGCIKIGFTSNLQNRIRTYQTSNQKAELLFAETGTITQEKYFHSVQNNGQEKYDKRHCEHTLRELRKFVERCNSYHKKITKS